MKIYYTTQANGKRIAEHKSGVLEPEIIEQPPEWYLYTARGNFFYREDDSFTPKLKYLSGTYRVFTPQGKWIEKWSHQTRCCESYIVVPQDSGMIIDLSVEVKRVSEITFDDVVELFNLPFSYSGSIRKTFIDWWNTRHAKPIKVGDHYECYPYNIESGCQFLGKINGVRFGDQPVANVTYRGLPLHIYPNPFIILPRYERREA